MKDLATHLRYLQLQAHNAHNQVTGEAFFADHEYLGELYQAYEEAYDAVVERIIGSGQEIDLVSIQKDAAAKLAKPVGVDDMFIIFLQGETVLCRKIEALCELPLIGGAKRNLSQGTLNLLAGIADASEVRQYKIGQRRG